MDRGRQGDFGEASARCWYELAGYVVYVPTGRSPDADFVADDGDRLIRVQVKCSGYRSPYGRWAVAIRTCGGNQSWNRVVKRFSPARCDELFVVTVDGRRWRIPSSAVEGTSTINLGGVKYAEYEVEPGPALGTPIRRAALPSDASAG